MSEPDSSVSDSPPILVREDLPTTPAIKTEPPELDSIDREASGGVGEGGRSNGEEGNESGETTNATEVSDAGSSKRRNKKDEEYTIEKILKRSVYRENGHLKAYYRIKWEGYTMSECTWEPADYIERTVPELVAEYRKTLRKPYRKRIKRSANKDRTTGLKGNEDTKSDSLSLPSVSSDAESSSTDDVATSSKRSKVKRRKSAPTQIARSEASKVTGNVMAENRGEEGSEKNDPISSSRNDGDGEDDNDSCKSLPSTIRVSPDDEFKPTSSIDGKADIKSSAPAKYGFLTPYFPSDGKKITNVVFVRPVTCEHDKTRKCEYLVEYDTMDREWLSSNEVAVKCPQKVITYLESLCLSEDISDDE